MARPDDATMSMVAQLMRVAFETVGANGRGYRPGGSFHAQIVNTRIPNAELKCL